MNWLNIVTECSGFNGFLMSEPKQACVDSLFSFVSSCLLGLSHFLLKIFTENCLFLSRKIVHDERFIKVEWLNS